MRLGFGLPTQLDVHVMETPLSNIFPSIWNDGLLVDLEFLSEPSLILWCGLEPEKRFFRIK